MRRKDGYKLQSTWNNTQWLKPTITTLDIFCWLLIVFKHVFSHNVKFHIWGDLGGTYNCRSFIYYCGFSSITFMWSKICGTLVIVHFCSHRECACDIWWWMWFKVVKSYSHHDFMLVHPPLHSPTGGRFSRNCWLFLAGAHSFSWLQNDFDNSFLQSFNLKPEAQIRKDSTAQRGGSLKREQSLAWGKHKA